jgi:hypothetical protein
VAARGYTDRDRVAAELGRTLTPDQAVQCDDLIEEVEAYVDNETGRAWLVPSPVAAEQHVPVGPFVYLHNTPVSSVTAVTIRSSAVGAAETALVAGTGYELVDPATGLLSLSSYPLSDPVVNGPAFVPGAIVKVSYTFATPVPADIRRAATLLAAHWLTPRLEPGLGPYESVSVGQGDLSVKYRDLRAAPAVPSAVDAILANYRRVVFA